MLALLLIGLVGLGGCAQFARVLGNHPPEVTVTPPPAPASKPPPPPVDTTPAPPLKTIIARQLEQGHYAKGRKQLHRYIQQHPDDRAARDMWRQLTANPDKVLGSRSRIHKVRPGETYGSLAARYLGDSGRFLILARYNDATNPSRLDVGQRVRIPLDAHLAARGRNPGKPRSAASGAARPAVASSSLSKAEALQQQSLAQLDQGHHRLAMRSLRKALDLDPKLKSPGGKTDGLRRQLLANYHQRAIILYRDQKLSQAISLWDKILAIDPNYEPAIIYRARARELQSRLKQL